MSTNELCLGVDVTVRRIGSGCDVEQRLDFDSLEPLAEAFVALEAGIISRLILQGPTSTDRVTLEKEEDPDIPGYGSTWNEINGQTICYLGAPHLGTITYYLRRYMQHGHCDTRIIDFYLAGRRSDLTDCNHVFWCAEYDTTNSIDITGMTDEEIYRLDLGQARGNRPG